MKEVTCGPLLHSVAEGSFPTQVRNEGLSIAAAAAFALVALVALVALAALFALAFAAAAASGFFKTLDSGLGELKDALFHVIFSVCLFVGFVTSSANNNIICLLIWNI